VCGADFPAEFLGPGGAEFCLILHRDAEHNGARDLEDILAMREADEVVPFPRLAPAHGIWSTEPRNDRAKAANARAGFSP